MANYHAFPEYLETAHLNVFSHNSGDVSNLSMVQSLNSVFGLGEAVVTVGDPRLMFEENRPLYEMFYTFLIGSNPKDFWHRTLAEVETLPNFAEMKTAYREFLDDKLYKKLIPEFITKMREIQAVQSSSFMVGKVAIEQNVLQEFLLFCGRIDFTKMKATFAQVEQRMVWNLSVVQVAGVYHKGKMSLGIDFDISTKNKQTAEEEWNIRLFAYARDLLNALGPRAGHMQLRAKSPVIGAVSTGVSGAVIGYYCAQAMSWSGPVGIVIGFIVGFAIGWFLNS